MRLIASICALFAIVGAFACASLGNKRERQALDARMRVVECFKRRGVVANDLHLDAVPVRFVPFAESTCSLSPACYRKIEPDCKANCAKEVLVGTYGKDDWRADFEVRRSLQHEYVHALLDISGLPQVEHPEPLMEDCEQ